MLDRLISINDRIPLSPCVHLSPPNVIDRWTERLFFLSLSGGVFLVGVHVIVIR